MRPSPTPSVDTLHDPRLYPIHQLVRAIEVCRQVGATVGGERGYVFGETGRPVVLGTADDRGVLVLAEPPRETPA